MGLSSSSTLLIAALVAAFAGAIAAGYWLQRRRRDARLREQHLPQVVMPILATLDVARPVRHVARNAATPPQSAPALSPPLPAPVPNPAAASHAHPSPGAVPGRAALPPRPRFSPAAGVRSSGRAAAASPNEIAIVEPGAEYATLVDGHSIRFYRPADGTLQFLPGRLVVVEGRDSGHEIRFVKTTGPDSHIITFGRLEGAPYRHIQLREPTVSRQHARMTLTDGHWQLENLSRTNPVVVNGSALGGDAGVTLKDGDRVEMGEVTFRFHT